MSVGMRLWFVAALATLAVALPPDGVAAGRATALAFALTADAQPPGEGFVPLRPDQTQEALPATPLVFAAYGFVWLALAAYILLLWRRLSRVERELSELKGRGATAKRG